jgi:hypothetical protein
VSVPRSVVWLLVLWFGIGQSSLLAASDYFGQVTFNGLPVPGATVTATQADPSTSLGASNRRATTTNADGIYHLAELAEGLWTLTIELFGFATTTREIAIPTKEDPPPDALSVRSFDELTRALPPARTFETVDPLDDEPLDQAVLTGPVGMAAADGLLINGSLNNGASTPFALPRGIGNNRPRPPGIYSYAAGFQMGTSAWDARPFSLIGSQSARPSYADTQTLGTLQGPIRLPWLRNPITLMLGYQGTSATNVITQSTRMPTALERAGDFSHTLDARGQPVRLVDPTTGQPFEGNAIPAGRISPQAAALLAYYPVPPEPSGEGGFNHEAPVVSATRQDSAQSRAGYSIRGDNRIEGGVSYQRGSGRSTSLFGFEDSRASSGLTASGALTLRPARNMTLSLRYQYSRTSTELLPHFANRVNVSGAAGISGTDQDPRNWGPPSLSFASDLAGLSSGSYASTTTRTQVWAADFSRFRGPHNIGLGIEARAIRNDVIGQQDPRGAFGFTGAATGLDFADFLLGLPQTSTIGFGNPDKQFRGMSYAVYATDDWRVRPSLTLTFGVRWEYETPITEAQGRLANLEVAPEFTEVSVVTASGGSDALVRADRAGLQPRLGLAWRPTLGSLVIRAGYGIYRNTNVYQSIATLLAAQPPFSTAFNIASSPSHALTLADGFTPSSATFNTFNTFAIGPDFRVASAHTWQVSVQRDLPGQLTLLGTYLGTRGTNLMQQVLPNTYPAGAENPCPACPAGFRYLMSNGRSMRHSGQIQVRRRLSAGFTAATEYTLAKSMDDAASFGGATLDGGALVQNWRDPQAEYARSSFDQRHLLTASVDYTTGSGISGGTLLDGWAGRLVKDWTLAARFSTGSGLPLTPVYFAAVGGTGIIGSLRPDLTGIANDPPDGAYANRDAFAAPAPGQWGNAPRNSITGTRTFSLDASVARTFRVNNRLNLDWRIDATNVLNRVTYAAVNALITSPQFGLPNRTNEMRKIRTSLRFRF